MSVTSLHSSEDEAIVIDHDDISNYNPEHILPQPPEEVKKIRNWLQPTDYAQDGGEFRKHLQSHMPGTGEWLMSSEAFCSWRDSRDQGLLWIKGIPGSGKSVVASHIIDSLTTSNPGSPVLYFFFRQIIDANHKPTALLRDWLDQVMQYSPPLQEELKEVVKRGRSLSSLSMEDLWNYLRVAFRSLTGKVFCIADALDEMDGKNDDFLKSLAALGKWKPNRVKILLTSRPVTAVEQPLRKVEMLKIRLEEKLVDTDIARYVRQGLSKLHDATTEEQEQIRKAVPGRANGIFLYAKLAMEAFFEPQAEIASVLNTLPADLHELYTGLLREHEIRSGVPHDIQLLILQWVTHATRPLRLIELAEVMSVAYSSDAEHRSMDLASSKRLVRAAAGPLLEILPNETVCVIHHSFTEYLKCITRSEEDGGYPILRLGDTHTRLALACLKYLRAGCLDSIEVHEVDEKVNGDDAEDLYVHGSIRTVRRGVTKEQEQQRIRLQNPFFSYAASNWQLHVTRSEAAGSQQNQTHEALNKFLGNDRYRKAWLKHMWRVPLSDYKNVTPLHVAARYGLRGYAQNLVEQEATVDAKEDTGKTALWWAANSGHASVIRTLVQAGAEADVDETYAGLKPLHEAAKDNHAEAVTALLEAGVNPLTPKTRENPGNWCGNAPRSVGHTPLMYACHNGHLEAVEAFLPFLTDSKTIQRALVWSAEKGRSKLVKSILQHPGVDVNAKVRGDTALYLACQSQDRDTIFALIDAGADPTILSLGSGDEFGGVDSRGTYYTGEDDDNGTESALFALCNRGRRYQSSDDSEALQELLTLLTNKGASIDQRAPGGSTLLHAAGNDLVLLRLLLSAGVDANTTDNLGQVPLHNADRLDSVSLLIEEGSAKLDFISSHDGRTPLMRSLAGYNTEVVLKLLEHGPDVSVKDKKGDGPLHILLGNHSAKTTVLRSLLAAGADPNKLNRMGETPLLIMRLDAKESMEHLDMLLEAGADIDAKDVSGMSLLSRLMRSGPQNDCEHNDIEALLERGADRLFRDHKGRTLLHHAVAHWAAKNTHSHSPKYVSRLDYLLSIGLDPQLRDHCGNSLIHECALRSSVLDPYYGSNNITLLKQLMDLDVEISARNQYGRTVLHILAATGTRGTQLFRCGEPSLLDFVISKFANLNTGDYQGLTALHFASTVCERTTKALLDAGADPTLTSLDGLTPLHLAARAQQSNIVGLLLDSRKNATKPFTELRDMRGRSALYYACRSGTYEVVKLLLDAGADASGKEMFQACCDFEEEQALWAANRHIADTEKNQNAGGLTVEDTSRPMLSSEISWRSLDLHPTRDVVRLEEIIDLLFKHGCDTTGLRRYLRGNNPATTSVYQGHAYTFRCLVEAYERAFPDTSQSQSSDSDDEDDYYYFVGDSINAKFGKLLIESHKIAQVDAALHLADTEERQFNSSLIARLLKRREFHAIKPLFEKGVDFLTGADEAHCSCIMETFIAHGYATILGEIGTLEARRQFNKGKWYAFNDPHSPGLYIESPHEEAKAGETRQCLFLLDALARAAPNMDVVRLLVEKFHVDVNQSVSEQNTRYSVGSQSTALHYLARGLHWWHVALAMPYLISKGANLEVKDANEATPLHVALGGPEGYVGPYSGLAVTTLLDAGANLNASESNQSYLARSIWDLSMLQNLLDRGAKVDADALHATVKYKKIEALKLLLKFHADPNLRRDPVPAVSIASKKRPGHWRTRFGLPRHEIYALYTAAETFDKDNPTVAVQLMEALLDAGADPFARYSKGPYQYCNDKELDEEETVIEVLRNHKPSEDAREVLLLHELLEDGKLSFPILNSPGLNVNVRDAQGRTIAHVICHKHSLNEPIDSVEYMSDEVAPSMMPSFMDCLLQHGANLRARDNNGRNIFHHIFESYRRCKTNAQSISDLPYLLKHYASLLNQADCYGKTPLHMALRYGVYQYNFEAAEILLDAGADPSAVDKFGNSCLHIVAIAIHRGASARSMFSNLLSRGLDINARNLRGETPIFYLNRFPYSTAQPELTLEDQILAADAVRLLENAGADLFAKDNAGQGLLHIAAKTDERHRRERDYAWCFYDRRSLPRSEAYLVRFQVLVQKGLDPMMEDKQKMTALDVAAACGNVSVLQLFEKDDLGSQKVIVAEI